MDATLKSLHELLPDILPIISVLVAALGPIATLYIQRSMDSSRADKQRVWQLQDAAMEKHRELLRDDLLLVRNYAEAAAHVAQLMVGYWQTEYFVGGEFAEGQLEELASRWNEVLHIEARTTAVIHSFDNETIVNVHDDLDNAVTRIRMRVSSLVSDVKHKRKIDVEKQQELLVELQNIRKQSGRLVSLARQAYSETS